ncbi:MAG: ankyrin repeat domain-containing protein [Vampirovibrionales bacterium]
MFNASVLIGLLLLPLVVGLSGYGDTGASSSTGNSLVAQAEQPKQPLPEVTGNPNAVVGEEGETRLCIAAKNGNAPLVQALINAGATVNQGDTYDWTPLHEASYHGHLEVVKVLLANGAKVNQADTYGWTPLRGASSQGHLEIAKVLLANGADKHRKANDGNTQFDAATNDTIKALLK